MALHLINCLTINASLLEQCLITVSEYDDVVCMEPDDAFFKRLEYVQKNYFTREFNIYFICQTSDKDAKKLSEEKRPQTNLPNKKMQMIDTKEMVALSEKHPKILSWY